MNQSKCFIDYSNGSIIECDTCGNYTIHDNSTLNLSLMPHGHTIYTPPTGGKYSLDYSGKDLILDAIDSSNQILKVDLQGETETSMDSTQTIEPHEAFKPRIFIINANGTGYEILESSELEKKVGLAQAKDSDVVVHDSVIPGTIYTSTIVVQPSIMIEDDDFEFKNMFGDTSLSVQELQVGQMHFSVQGQDKLRCLQFILFEPLSDQRRYIIETKQSECSKSWDLQKLWQNCVKATSEFLISYTSKKVDHKSSHKKVSGLKGTDLFAQRNTELQKVLGNIREGFIPPYFHNDLKSQTMQQSSRRTKEQILLSDLTSPNISVDSVSTNKSGRCLSMAHPDPSLGTISVVDSKQPENMSDHQNLLVYDDVKCGVLQTRNLSKLNNQLLVRYCNNQ